MTSTERPLELRGTIESHTRYVFDGAELHIHESDCTPYFHAMRQEHPTLNVAFHLKNLQQVELDFQGATLVLHGKIQPFLLEHCDGVTVKNLKILFERPSFTEMTVLETAPDAMRVRLNPHHPCRVKDGDLIPYCNEWENTALNQGCMFLQAFNPQTLDGMGLPLCIIGKNAKSHMPADFHPNHLVAEDGGDGTIVFRGTISPCYKVGATLVLGHEARVYSSCLAIESSDIHLESWHILNGAGMGILPIHSRDIFLKDVVFRHAPQSHGIITNQADAVHAFACSGKFDIDHCVFEGMMDDALNIHGQFYTLERCDGNTLTLNARLHAENANCPLFCPGDTIGVHRGATPEVLWKAAITDVNVLDDTHIRVTLDAVPPADLAAHSTPYPSIVENLSAQADITIRDTVFQHANSHLRFQSSGKIRILRCRIAMPVLLTGDAYFWFESSGIADMEVRDTAFVSERAQIRITPQVLPAEAAPYYHRNIRLVNCTFDSDHPLTASMADGIVFENTRQNDGKTMVLSLTNCGAVTAPGAILERKTEKKDSLRMN